MNKKKKKLEKRKHPFLIAEIGINHNGSIDLAKKLEGITRNAGRHAAGVVIAPKSLFNYMPLYCEQTSEAIVTQFDMGDVESIGLVKFDFLGLRTLTIIDWALKDVNRIRIKENKKPLDIRKIELDDSLTYKLIQNILKQQDLSYALFFYQV